MSTPLLLACLWVVVATATAWLPMRRQYIPGITLLITAPILLVYIGLVHGWWIGAICLLAVLSVMRNPLRYLIARARGERPEIPE
ncbi:DUF2484 family protein [Mesobacterium pallidum]|uniref:DUF2484 family protein n=1 Tax=Mesobacterium pallidum TaxID=2872037 RepID=UPI001EE19B51|nr:DUF2484 family protein [Mesobacterium pallidum]